MQLPRWATGNKTDFQNDLYHAEDSIDESKATYICISCQPFFLRSVKIQNEYEKAQAMFEETQKCSNTSSWSDPIIEATPQTGSFASTQMPDEPDTKFELPSISNLKVGIFTMDYNNCWKTKHPQKTTQLNTSETCLYTWKTSHEKNKKGVSKQKTHQENWKLVWETKLLKIYPLSNHQKLNNLRKWFLPKKDTLPSSESEEEFESHFKLLDGSEDLFFQKLDEPTENEKQTMCTKSYMSVLFDQTYDHQMVKTTEL